MLFPLYDKNPTHRVSWVNYSIIFINLVVLVWWMSLDANDAEGVLFQRGFIPARIHQLDNNKPLVIRPPAPVANPDPANPGPQAQLLQEHRLEPVVGQVALSAVTAMFLHAGLMHFMANMWFLWIFGNNIEDRLGHISYGLFYLVGGLFATGCHWFNDPVSPVPMIGASGAVAAVLGAYVITYPTAKVRTLLFVVIIFMLLDLPAWLVLGMWFVGQMLEAQNVIPGNLNGGVAWWAHVGGFAAGAVIMPVLTFARLVDEDDDSWLNFEDERFAEPSPDRADGRSSLPGPRF